MDNKHLDSISRPRVAVLLAACNGLPWIESQVESIFKQQDVDVELFISVDRSHDNTAQYCSLLQSIEPRVHVLDGEGPGFASGNFFRLMIDLQTSEYDYIALADQDDVWLDHKLIRGVECLRRFEADAYSSSYTAFWTDNCNVQYVDKSAPQTEYDFLFESPGPGCTFLLTPQLVRHLCQYLTTLPAASLRQLHFHDWLLYAFARYQGYRWHIDAKSFINYRQHGHNVLGANKGFNAMYKRLRGLLSGEWLSQAVLVAYLIGMEQHDFVRPWRTLSPGGMLFLLRHVGKIRRRRIDRLILVLLLPVMMLTIRHR